MRCDEVERDHVVERYLSARLSAQEREAFEEHYFSCPRCFAALEACRALQPDAGQAPTGVGSARTRRRAKWHWALPAAAAAAAAALVVVVARARSPSSQPRAPLQDVLEQPRSHESSPDVEQSRASVSLAALAQVDPPPYTPTTLRGNADQATHRFRLGMRHYVKRDFAGAVPDLSAAVKLKPRAPDAHFFLGICSLLTDQTDLAISHLRAVVALGDTPYLDEAHFYLAKAYLRQANVAGARSELGEVIRLKGDQEPEARQILGQLENWRESKP